MRITDVYVGYLKITILFWGVVSESAVSANINQYIPPRNGCG